MAAAETQIKITADTAQAEREIKKLEKALEGINGVGDSAATALAGITAAAAAMGFAILKTLDSAGQLIDASKALGVSVQSLQTLEHAAALAGVSADQLTGSLIRMSNNLGSGFASGTGPAVEAMKQLGIPMREIMALRPDAQFAKIAAELNKMTNPAERNALAIDLLGKQGPKLLEVANNTASAKREMEALGLALSDMDVAALDAAGDSVDELKSIFDAGLKKAVAEIAPYIVEIVNKIKEAIEEAGGFEAVWQNIKDAIKTALNIAIFTAVIGALTSAVGAAVALRIAIKEAGVAMGIFNAVVMKNPLMLAVGAAFLLAKVLGIDVAGAMGDALFPAKEMEKTNEKIADAAKETADANEEVLTVSTKANKEQQKALDALKESITKLTQSAALQKDILKYGEDEAKVRQVLSQEQEKLQKVGLSLNSQQKERIRDAVLEEASIKKQITLRKEQAATGLGAIAANYTPVESALQKHLDYQLTMTGNTQAEIEKLKADEFAVSERLRKQADLAAKDSVNKVIDAEIGKYDTMYAMKKKQSEDFNALLQLDFLNELEYAKLSEEQKLALSTATANAMRQHQMDRLALEKSIQDQIYQYELTRIENTLMAQRKLLSETMSDSDKAVLQKQGVEERQKAIVSERINFEKKSETEKAAFAIDQGAQMFSALGAHNKKAFEAAKAFNIANAIMNTYMGATKALATYPPPFNFIAAAAVVGMGMAQVASIRSQQYSGRALGGPVMGNQPYIVGENGPELFTPSSSGGITRNQDLGGSGGTTNINFTIVANDTNGFDQLLTDRKGLITQIIRDAQMDRGVKGMV